MSSFLENAAAAKIEASPAQNSVNVAYGSANDGASGVHAPPPVVQTPPPKESVQAPVPVSVFKPESVVVPAPAAAMTAAEVVKQFAASDAQSNGNGEGSNGLAVKRKRGRPRKYIPGSDGSFVIASPVSAIAPQSKTPDGSVGGGGEVALSGLSSGKRGRGRPAGSRGRSSASPDLPFTIAPTVSGLPGVGFTPHVVQVQPGMDVFARLMSFSQVNSQAVCVLSANGTIGSVTLQQSSSCGGTVSYEGRFQILSISGSFLLSESGGQRSRTGGLSVSLAGPDGTVLGGGVAGLLIAASPVQVVVGTFMAANPQATRPGYNDTAPKHVSTVGGSPPSRATLSELPGGPVIPFNNNAGGCNNNNQQTAPNVPWS
ncbi:AT-hook motif nuclear-localized protein 10-like [Apium graveolens]|uniref:AT-hook motif nuclear-localized protein 10-like n=1 Tax=Apium graveolens TaxID=4045 RepID=UPI003D7B1765